MDNLKEIVADQMKSDIPAFKTGDHIRVHVRVIEGDKERIQPYEGDVINIRGAGLNKTFTVRKIASGVGVERIFSYYSPKISKIEIIREGKVRRAKLFYLRELSGKAARIKDKRVK
ncbi:MAG TPA: 50S ribosomal protein L19 [Melioribacteraceae bacterium]|nr:50S ribosomal protein L19 [Melioribacteraceae bacterium]